MIIGRSFCAAVSAFILRASNLLFLSVMQMHFLRHSPRIRRNSAAGLNERLVMVKNKLGACWARFVAVLAMVAMLGLPAMATDPTAPDASTIVTTATNTFYTVGALVAAVVGFFVIIKIVKWIRK